MHEAFRVFYDRLVDDNDRKWFFDYVVQVTNDCFHDNFHSIFSNLDTEQTGVVTEDSLRSLMFCDFGDPNIKKYMEVKDINLIKAVVENSLVEYNLINKRPMTLVLFKYVNRLIFYDSHIFVDIKSDSKGLLLNTYVAFHVY